MSHSRVQSFKDIYQFISENKTYNQNFIRIINNLIASGEDLTQENNLIFKYCLQVGDKNTLKELIDNNVITADEENSYALKLSAFKGHESIFKMLVLEYKCDFTISNNTCFFLACEYGNKEIVKFILETKKVKANMDSNEGLKLAVKNGHLALTSLFVEDYKCDEHSVTQDIIQEAIKRHNTTTVEYILARQAGKKTTFKPLEEEDISSMKKIKELEEQANRDKSLEEEVSEELDLENNHQEIILSPIIEKKEGKFMKIVNKFF